MEEAAVAHGANRFVAVAERGVIGGGAEADLLDCLFVGEFRETVVDQFQEQGELDALPLRGVEAADTGTAGVDVVGQVEIEFVLVA